jgi:hypothetical protein
MRFYLSLSLSLHYVFMYIYMVGSKVLKMEKNLDAVLDMSVGRSVGV